MHTYIHTYMHAYIHTYIHVYLHVFMSGAMYVLVESLSLSLSLCTLSRRVPAPGYSQAIHESYISRAKLRIKPLLPPDSQCTLMGDVGVSKNWGPFCGSFYTKDHKILGSTIGPMIFLETLTLIGRFAPIHENHDA